MNTELSKLKQENQRLNHLLEQDWLTQIYNRGATEEKINQFLEKYQMGVMMVIDVDDFKNVNDQYGHLMGDELLIAIAAKLKTMFLRNDIVGRIGGDEFVVFIAASQDETFAEQRAKQVKNQLKTLEVKNCSMNISVTIGAGAYRPGDTYKTIFDRADQMLMLQKQKKRNSKRKKVDYTRGIEMDMLRIRAELEEARRPKGAYFREYQEFKSIYRFVERRLQRMNSSAYIVLMTLTDSHQNLVEYEKNDDWMETLYDVIQSQLRVGDVFTQYSSCQYLVMLSDIGEDDSEAVADRITEAFYHKADARHEKFLLHHCYPMNS